MNKSTSLSQLSLALAKAQAEMPRVIMNSVNPFLKNKFADLGAVIEASRPVLARHGLSISQFPTYFENRVGVTTILLHESGEWLEETVLLAMEDEKGKSAAQVAGSIISYLRRYSWSAVLGLYADEDTDGEPVKRHPAEREQKSENFQPPKKEYAETSVITVTPQWVVENGFARTAENEKGKTAEAANLINNLLLVGKPVEIARAKLTKYWALRDDGLEPRDAAAKVLEAK